MTTAKQARLFIGNVSYRLGEDQLQAEILRLGVEARNVRIARRKETSEPLGFAFADVDADAVDAAIAKLDGKEIDSRVVNVERAKSAPPVGGGSPARGGSRRPAPAAEFGEPWGRRNKS